MMPNMKYAAAATMLMATAATSAPPVALQSGLYEGMMLAVAPDGSVTGAFRQERGEAVTRSCAFTIAGARGLTGQVMIQARTHGGTRLRGTLRPTPAGISLDLPGVSDVPGCGDVLPSVRANVVELDRTAPGNWSTLVRVARGRAVLRPTATGRAARGPYVVAGDVVGVIARRGEMLHVAYPSSGGRESRGWISTREVIPVPAS